MVVKGLYSTRQFNLPNGEREKMEQHGNPLAEAQIEQRICFLVTTPRHPPPPFIPHLSITQSIMKRCFLWSLTVATSPLRLAVGHSRGEV